MSPRGRPARWLTAAALAAGVVAGGPAAAGNPTELGALVLDRAAGRFTVPGTVLRVDPPLEYLAVARGGIKDYESLLSLDTDGKTFNLACILIGLEPAKGGVAARPLDRSVPWEGERVRLWVSWQEGGQQRRLPAAALLRLQAAEPAADDWVYGGSAFSDDGRYLADVTGTLIGFVHDPVSIIEHRVGLGVGAYGAVGGDPVHCPPVGSRVHLTVERNRPDSPAPRPADPQPR